MKYKAGDKVKIKSKEWYEESKDDYGKIPCGETDFVPNMAEYCGRLAKIIGCGMRTYEIDTDCGGWSWTDEMFEDEKEEQAQITLPAPDSSQATLDQISTLTHTFGVLCTTGRSKSASIVEEKLMGLIEKL